MSDPIADLTAEVLAGVSYRLTLSAQVVEAGAKYPALLRFVFEDAGGTVLPEESAGEGFLSSDIFGTYRYIGRPGKSGPTPVDLVFRVPAGAVRLTVELHRWQAGAVRLLRKMALDPATPLDAEAIAEAQLADRIIATRTFDVRPGESYDMLFDFTGTTPLEERGILASVRFVDGDGARVDPPPNLPTSAAAGAFRYIAPGARALSGTASVTVPAHAQQMQIRLLHWIGGRDWALRDMRLIWLGDPAITAAEGRVDLPVGQGDDRIGLRARLRAVGGTSTKLGALQLVFEDAQGAPIQLQGDNLSRSDRFMNHIPLRTPPAHLMAADGSFSLARPFAPPAGAVRMLWRLLDVDNGWQLEMCTPPALCAFDPAPAVHLDALPADRRWQDASLDPDRVAALVGALPGSSLWEAVALSQLHLLGVGLLPVRPGTWVAVTGTLSAPPHQVLAVPTYFDAEGQPLAEATGTGCARIGTLPPARDVALSAGDHSFRACFLAPEDAAYAVFTLTASAENATPPVLSDLDAGAVDAQTVCDGLDPARQSVVQLRATLQLAQATGRIALELACSKALAILVPQEDTFATRAAQLERRLAPLDPQWLPALGPAGQAARDPLCVLHLRADAGTLPPPAPDTRAILCLPLAAAQDVTQPDGPVVVADGPLRVVRPQAAGLDPLKIPEQTRLVFEAAFAAQIAAREAAGLVHGCGDSDILLTALAVARAQGLPLVLEVAQLPAAETEAGRLDQAQTLRCLAAAQAVLAPQALHGTLLAGGLAADALIAATADTAQDHTDAYSLARAAFPRKVR
ncbi:hypothetical protein ABMC89_18720 [Sulfitobacter sp. HNIBRBA3233]|uniref:hypothetical protein n=1 Tax=Sulfitobacter marinivivus TaxID=3158558 RepID=UPI0032DEBEE0